MSSPDVVVVGAGIAGLSCARRVREAGLTTVVLEAGDGPGGRVRTDEIDGFRLDRGFQVLPLAYPEARLALDYESLRLRPFARGALVRHRGRFRAVADPRRAPLRGLQGFAGGVVGLRDVPGVIRLLRRRGPDVTAAAALREVGISERAIQTFFAPYLSGIFLERDLATSSRLLEFVLSNFSSAPAAVPAAGMGAVPAQLGEGLDVRLGSRAIGVTPGVVHLETGDPVRSRAVVVATAGLLDEVPVRWNGVSCLYFDAAEPPVKGPWLVLDGDGDGPVNNLAVLSEVAPECAPPGRSLVSVSVIGPEAPDVEPVREQLGRWFGSAVQRWRLITTYRIPEALPALPVHADLSRPVRIEPGLYACGDHREHPSLNGALRSGRRAAEALIEDLELGPTKGAAQPWR